VACVVLVAKIFGFVKQVVVAGVFGANSETDLFFLAERFSVNIDYVIFQIVLAAFVPVYLEAKKRGGPDALRLTSESIRLFSLVVASLVLAVVLLSPFIAWIIAPSYSSELTAQLAFYIRIFAPLIIFSTLQSVFHAILNANKRFVPGQMAGIIQSVVIIGLSLVAGNVLGVRTLVIGFFAYSLLNFMFLGALARRDWRIRSGDFRLSRDMKRMLSMMLPLFWGCMFNFANQQVNKIIVSGMEPGSFSAMNYGVVLSNFVSALIVAVCTVLYTEMSAKIANGEAEKASAEAIRMISVLVTIVIPITVISVIFPNEITAIVFERGAFDRTAALNTAQALAGYGFLFVPFVIKNILSQLHYAHGDAKSPVKNSIAGILFNMLFSFLLYRRLGLFGVTLASSIGVFISAVLNIISARRMKYIDRFQPLVSLVPVWCAGLAAAVGMSFLCAGLLSDTGVFLRFSLTACAVTAVSLGITAPFVFKKVYQEAE